MPKNSYMSPETTCTTGELAEALGISLRTVRDLMSRGLIVKGKHGHVLLWESVKRYTDHLRDTKAKHGGDGSLTSARAKLTEAQLVEQQLRNAKLTGDLISVSDAQVAWGRFGSVVKSSVLAIPSRARQLIPHMTAHDGQTLRQLCVDVLNEAAENLEGGDVAGATKDEIVADVDEIIVPAQPKKKKGRAAKRLS